MPLRLTRADAVRRALTANASLKASSEELALAKVDVERSKAWLPSNPYFTAGGQRTSESSISSNYEFLLSQEFEVGGQRAARLATARAGLERARWDVKSAEQGLVITVQTAFVDTQVDIDRVQVAQQGLADAVRLSSALAQHPHPTDSQRLDLNVAQIQESRARRGLAATQLARDKALNSLRHLLGIPADQEIELAGAPQATVQELPPLSVLIDRALKQRADLAALQQAVRRADSDVTLMRRQEIPNITLSGGYSRFQNDSLTGGDISVPIPLFQRRTADVHQALAEREQAALQAHDLAERIRQNVADARRACVETGLDLQTMQRDILPKSKENLQLEQRQFARGEVTVSELVGISIDLNTARNDYLDTLQAYNEALINLGAAVGGRP